MIASVRGRFLATITVVTVVAFSVVYLWNLSQIRAALLDQQAVQVDGLVERLQTSLPNALWEYNQRQVEKTVNAEMAAPHIVGINVFDRDRLIYSTMTVPGVERPSLNATDGEESRIYLRKVPLSHDDYAGNQTIGSAEIFISDATVTATIASQAHSLLSRLISAGLAIIGVTYLVLCLMVIAPLNDVRAALEQVTVESADLSTRMDENPLVEFRGITRAFNRFVGKAQRVLGGSIDDVHQAIQEVAEGDLSRHISHAADDTDSIMRRLATMQERLRETHALTVARDAADSANRAKSEFISNMNHEIRNPLTAIIGMADMLETTQLDPEQKEFVQVLQKSSSHLLGLVNDILDYSKLEDNHLVLEYLPFTIEDVIQDAVEVLQEVLNDSGVRLSFQICPEARLPLLGDALRIRQIVINFLTNASRFAAGGSVEIRVTMPSLSKQDATLRIEVADDGVGIDPATVDHLFKRFSQADSTTTRRFGGTGLGLAICKRLAELMDGRVGVQSVPGEGACFWCELRLDIDRSARQKLLRINQEPSGDTGPVRETPPVNIHQARILLVEDVVVNQRVVEAMLVEAGAEVHIATDGYEAIAAVNTQRRKGEPFEVVLMDLHMPNLDGFSAIEGIRAIPENAQVRIIAMTADATTNVRKRTIELGANDFLSKPFVRSALWAIVSEQVRPKTFAPRLVSGGDKPLS